MMDKAVNVDVCIVQRAEHLWLRVYNEYTHAYSFIPLTYSQEDWLKRNTSPVE